MVPSGEGAPVTESILKIQVQDTSGSELNSEYVILFQICREIPLWYLSNCRIYFQIFVDKS